MSKVPKAATKGKRGARGMGRLFKKVGAKQYPADSNVRGNYYLTYTVSGKRITTALRDSDENPITDRTQAENERRRILAPFITGDEVEALQVVRARIDTAEIKRAAAESEATPPPELDEIWREFLKSPNRPDSGESTLNQYNAEWRRFVSWMKDHHPATIYLHEVTTPTAADYARNLTAAKVSPSTYNQHRNLLRMIWRVMADECRLTANPWDKIQKRKLNALASRKRALTAAQYESLLAAAANDPDLHDLFVLLAWTGLRRADAILMKFGAVDFSRKVITLAPIKTARRQGKEVNIPIFPAAMDVLNRRQSGRVLNPKGQVFPKLATEYKNDPAEVTKRITAVFEKAGMQTSEKRADRGQKVVVYGAHSFRHLFVTAATSAGMPDAMIKSITGHGSDGMLEHYQQIGVDLAASLAGQIQGIKQLTGDTREPLPAWAADLVETMDGKTWKTIKAELLKGGVK